MKQKEYNNAKLGRGISALISNNKNKEIVSNDIVSNDIATEIFIDKIIAGKYQPRSNFDQEDIEKLSQSIKENKLIQPIIVRELKDKNIYEIIAGERRFRASKLAGFTKIPAIIRKINDKQALEMAIVENIQRKDLTVIEEAVGYKRMVNEFKYSQEEVANKVGKSRSHVTNMLRLLQLPINVQNMVSDNLITMGHARALINCDNAELIANKILQDSLNVRQVEDIIRNQNEVRLSAKIIKSKNSNNIQYINSCKEINSKYQVDSFVKYNKIKDNGQIVIKFDSKLKLEKLLNILSSNESK